MCFKPNKDDGFKSTVSDLASSNMALAQAAKSILGLKSERIGHLALTLHMRNEFMAIVRAVDDAMSPAGGGRGVVVAAEFTILGEKMDIQCNWSDMVRYGKRFLSYFNTLAQVACSTWVPSQDDRCPLLFGHVPLLRSVILSTAAFVTYPILLLSKLLANCTMLSELYIGFDSHRVSRNEHLSSSSCTSLKDYYYWIQVLIADLCLALLSFADLDSARGSSTTGSSTTEPGDCDT